MTTTITVRRRRLARYLTGYERAATFDRRGRATFRVPLGLNHRDAADLLAVLNARTTDARRLAA